MAAHETRMLLLGAVAMFGPINGYQIRRELVSWEVDRWAHVNPGSIYNGLSTLTRRGLLTRHDIEDRGREVAVYEITEVGREELQRLMVSALITVDPYDRIGFHVAFGMIPLLAKGTVLECLEERRRALEIAVDGFPTAREAAADGGYGPPHAVRSLMLWRDSTVTELAWLRDVLHDIGTGALRFGRGEDWGWLPPEDDPGWQMHADRERYRVLLGR